MPRQPSTDQLERQTDLLAVLHHIAGSLTDWVAQTRGQMVNHVLLNRLAQIGADGTSGHSFSVPFGSIAIQNLGAHQMTVAGDGPQLGPPVRGNGVQIIPAGSSAVINLVGRAFTVYGTAGDVANLQVFSNATPPAYGGGTGTAGGTGPAASTATGTGSSASAAATAALSSVVTGAATAAVLAANPARKGLLIANETTPAYLAYAATATATAYTVIIPPGAYWEAPTPIYTGPLSVIAPAGAGALRVTETT